MTPQCPLWVDAIVLCFVYFVRFGSKSDIRLHSIDVRSYRNIRHLFLKEATMARLLTPTSILLTAILLAVDIPAHAVDRTFQIEVESSIKGTVPSNRGPWKTSARRSRSPSLRRSFHCKLR